MTIEISEIKKENVYDVLAKSFGFEIRPHQKDMFYHLINTTIYQNTILAPRCAGKSTVSVLYMFYKLLLDKNCKIAFISHNKDTSAIFSDYMYSLSNNDNFISIFGNITEYINNIDYYSIHNPEKLIGVTKQYDEMLFHDIGIDTRYDKHEKLLENYNKFILLGLNRIVIGTQSTYYDIYTKIRENWPFDNRMFV